MAARNPNFTTQFQEFMKESFEKESSQRLAWFNKRRTQSMNRPRQLEVFRKKITEGSKPSEALLEKLPAIGTEARHNRKKADLNDPLLENRPQAPLELQSEMRPPSPKTRSALYDGFTKEGKGRYQYLRKRYDTIPEKKFEFPILSSWDYGWRMEDVIKKEDIKKPPFGRTRIVNDTFYTRNGIAREGPQPLSTSGVPTYLPHSIQTIIHDLCPDVQQNPRQGYTKGPEKVFWHEECFPFRGRVK